MDWFSLSWACLGLGNDEPATEVHVLDWELNPQLFGMKASALTIEKHQPELHFNF